jgi:hypothetical protein
VYWNLQSQLGTIRVSGWVSGLKTTTRSFVIAKLTADAGCHLLRRLVRQSVG